MSIGYVLAAKIVFSVREVFFRDRLATRILLALAFCLAAHCFWVTAQFVFSWGAAPWSQYWRMILQAAAIAAYSSMLAPILIAIFTRIRKLLMNVRSQKDR